MQICISPQTDDHPTTQFFTGRMPFLPPNEQLQSTEGKRRLKYTVITHVEDLHTACVNFNLQNDRLFLICCYIVVNTLLPLLFASYYSQKCAAE